MTSPPAPSGPQSSPSIRGETTCTERRPALAAPAGAVRMAESSLRNTDIDRVTGTKLGQHWLSSLVGQHCGHCRGRGVAVALDELVIEDGRPLRRGRLARNFLRGSLLSNRARGRCLVR